MDKEKEMKREGEGEGERERRRKERKFDMTTHKYISASSFSRADNSMPGICSSCSAAATRRGKMKIKRSEKIKI